MFQFSGRITQAPRFLSGVAKQLNNVLALHSKGLVIDSNDIIPEQQPDGRIRLRLNPKQGWRQGSGAGPVTSITGACCIGTDCSITTEADCAGTWQGAGSGCSPNPCSGGGGETGACCIDGDCSIQTVDDCTGMGGSYQGNDTECDPNPCGACCYYDGTLHCTNDYNETFCGILSGTWKPGISCADDPCEGACCSHWFCEITKEAECLALQVSCESCAYGRAWYPSVGCNPCFADTTGYEAMCCDPILGCLLTSDCAGDCEFFGGYCLPSDGTTACCPDCCPFG